MRRRSGTNFQQLINKQWNILAKTEQHQILNSFRKTEQRNGGITFYDMINILRSIGLCVTQQKKDQINEELAHKQIRVIDINVVLNQATALKKEKQEGGKGEVSEENQYFDSFVALGGGTDKGGFVKKQVLTQTIKRQFELTFDIEALIDGVQGDNLDYTAFCSIFQQDKERGNGRLASAASQRSLQSSDSIRSLVLDERDFQKFMNQYEGQEGYQ